MKGDVRKVVWKRWCHVLGVFHLLMSRPLCFTCTCLHLLTKYKNVMPFFYAVTPTFSRCFHFLIEDCIRNYIKIQCNTICTSWNNFSSLTLVFILITRLLDNAWIFQWKNCYPATCGSKRVATKHVLAGEIYLPFSGKVLPAS